MASLWKHPKSKYWSACYTDSSGRQLKRSTKETDRRKAMKIAEALEEPYRRRMTGAQVRKVFHSILQEVTGDSLVSVSVKDYLEGYLKRRKAEIASATNTHYSNASKRFQESLGAKAEQDLAMVTDKDVLSFRDELAATLKPATVNGYIKALRMMLRAARQDGVIEVDPTERVKRLRQNKSEDELQNARRAFTLDELRAVLRCAEDSEWRSLILFGLYTGQRLGDIARLRWNNVDLAAGEIRFTTQKTGRRVLVPICAPLAKHLLEIPSADDGNAPVHPVAARTLDKGKGDGKVNQLSRQFGELLARAGLREARSHAKRTDRTSERREANALSFHSLRHTATSMLKNAGVSASIVQDIIGHDSAEVSRAYTHIEADAKRSALEKLPEL